MSKTGITHRWTLRLAGDCLLDVEFEIKQASGGVKYLGDVIMPKDWEFRARANGYEPAMVVMMVENFRAGYNAAMTSVLRGEHTT